MAPRASFRLGWWLWFGSLAVVVRLVLTETIPQIPYGVYRDAGAHWLARQPLYELTHIDKFQYFPHAALIFAPFAWLGDELGAVAWRLIGWLGLAWGVFRLLRETAPATCRRDFAIVSVLVIGPSIGSLGNGQANLAMAALLVHALVDLQEARWRRAAWLFAFGLALKPLMLVPWLLALALFPRVRRPSAGAALVVAAAPFFFAPPDYVFASLRANAAKLALSAQPDRVFEDLAGMVQTLTGVALPHRPYFAARALAGIGVLALLWRARASIGRRQLALHMGCGAAAYLMLFNPRNQATSYVLLAAFAGPLCVQTFRRGARGAGCTMVVALAVWTVATKHVYGGFENWAKAAATLLFLVPWIAPLIRRGSAPP